MIAACPTAGVLERWLGGDETADGVAEHVAACSRCQLALDRLSDDPELREMAAGLAKTDTVVPVYTLPKSPTTHRQPVPDRVGPYLLGGELGRGGMGVVYRGHDDVLGRPAAIKLLRRDALRQLDQDRLMREARSAARVRHPNVVGIYSAGVADDGSPYLAMELVEGPTLAEVIRTRQRLAPCDAAEIVASIADGLAAAHAEGLVHRDVKPANVLIAQNTPKLADFGLVRDEAAETALTAEGTIAGTPSYLAPEQAEGKPADVRSDVYGLGVVLYEMLVGEVPFRGPAIEVLRQVLDDDPRPPRQIDKTIPQDLETIALKALAKEPVRRYPSAAEFAADVRRWLNNEPILARPAGAAERVWRWCRRNPRVAVLTGTVAVLLIALAAGGTTAAFVVNRAYERAKTDREHAVAARESAFESRRSAVEAKQRAEADFDVALKSVFALVDTVQKQMGSQPGLLPVKKMLLETAADGLKKIVHGPEDRDRTADVMIVAHHKLGDVYSELARTADAKKEFEAALAVGEAWLTRQPNNLEALRAQANTCDRLGDFARIAAEVDATRDWYARAMRNRKQAIELGHDNAQLRRDLSISLNKLGDAEGLAKNWLAARANYEQSLEMVRQRANDEPLRLRLLDGRFTRNRLSDVCVTLGDLDAAQRYSAEAVTDAREIIKIDENFGRVELANALERAGWVATHRFDSETAVNCRGESVALRRAAAAAEPNSALHRRNVAYAVSQYADALAAAGRFAEARPLYIESVTTYAEAVEADPDSVQSVINLSIAFVRVVSIHEYPGEYARAAEWAEKLIAFARRFESNPKLGHLHLASFREKGERCLAAYRYAADRGLNDIDSFRDEPAGARRVLLRLKVLEAGWLKDRDTVAQTAPLLAVDTDAIEALAVARAYARADDGDQALEYLRRAFRLDPTAANDLALYAEFRPFRERPDFQALRPKAKK